MMHLSDTSENVRLVQEEILKGMKESDRLQIAFALTVNMINLSELNDAKNLEDLDDQSLFLRKIEIRYGSDLANQIRSHKVKLRGD